MSIRKLPDGTIEADTGEELAAYERMLDKLMPKSVLKPTGPDWLLVCKSHFILPPEEKCIGLPGEFVCPLCSKKLQQGPGSVTMRPASFEALFVGGAGRAADDELFKQLRRGTTEDPTT